MTFTVETVARSLADYLAPLLPGVRFYEGPNQQGSQCPCLFPQQRYAHIEKRRQDGVYLRRVGLDLTYLEDYHLTELQQKYQRVAEVLDGAMETFPYFDGEETAVLRTYEREWRIDADALHYRFELRVWVRETENGTPMEHLETRESVR